jgi:hypothetical protein
MNGVISACLVFLVLLAADSARALTLQPVGGGFDEPIYVTSDPADPNRLFVVERKGTIRLLQGGVTSLFADIRSRVGCGSFCSGETGLLSMALAPDFRGSGRFYVDYANEVTGSIHVEEMVATGPLRETALSSTPQPVLSPIPHPVNKNHLGGQLQVDAGNLFISTGDGGGANDEFHTAQDPESLLGKILRVTPTPGGGHAVPAGNPFPTAASPYNTIWSLGLRNPFRFSLDRLTGAMVIGDVGEKAREEVDFAPAPGFGAGANYGWNCREGFLPGPATDPRCATPPVGGFAEPVFDYPHTPDPEAGGESRCAIIGGYVVRDPGLGALYGHYLYSDNCGGTIRSLELPAIAGGRATGDCWTGLTVPNIVSFGEDAAARLYAVSGGGDVFRIAGPPSPSCPILPQPQPLPPAANPRPTFIGIKAVHRRVPRGKKAVLTIFVSPCSGRKGDPVTLLRNGRRNGTRFLDRACTARFLPRIRKGTRFRAWIRENDEYQAAISRRLTIRIAHRFRVRR